MRLALLASLALLAPAALTQTNFESAILPQIDVSGNDSFSFALDIDGDVAAVGAPGWDAGQGAFEGHVQMFTRSGSAWVPGQTLTAGDGAPGDSFGRAVALSGDVLLIGAPYKTSNGLLRAGVVYVFREVGGTWSEVGKLAASDETANAFFGVALAVDGSLAVASAPGVAPSATSSEGHVYVLEPVGGNWTETQVLIGDVELAEEFGEAVDVHAGRIVVGSPKDDNGSGAFQTGSVYLFERVGGSFAETHRFLASDGVFSDGLGDSVAIWGDTVVAGSPRHDTPDYWKGAAYVWDWDGSDWVEVDQLVEADEAPHNFAAEVALEGDLLAVTNPTWVVGSFTQVGSVVVFRRGACGRFLAEQRVIGSTLGNFANFGRSLAFSGTTLLGGSSFWQSDEAFVFELGDGPQVTSYCTAGTSASGCQATVSACGSASNSGFGPFDVTVTGVEGGRKGILFFGSAANNAPWGSGSSSFLCVQAPTKRTGVQSSGGSVGACDGSFALDFSDWMQANPSQAPAPGADAYLQAWFRDPSSPKTTSLSDAISFPIAP